MQAEHGEERGCHVWPTADFIPCNSKVALQYERFLFLTVP